ncbi:hypothetical protein ACOKM3_02175 [Streptomyces sp. BH106]|uniref:hypothetical protein n=1 Tax=Streptomyces sp. BH106 TaxID=3410409 RepID=UPI003CF60AC2
MSATAAITLPAHAGPDVFWDPEDVAHIVETATGTSDVVSESTSDTDSVSVITSDTGTIDIPRSASDSVTMTGPSGEKMGIDLPVDDLDSSGKSESGTVAYATGDAPVATAVQATTDGDIRTLMTLKDKTAPNQFSFALDLPEGVELSVGDSGEILMTKDVTLDDAEVDSVLSDGETADALDPDGDGLVTLVVGEIEPPWAQDANGASLPTSYEVSGSTVTQTIETSDDTAYPVVADPKVSFGWWIYVRWSKSEVKKVSSKIAGGVAVASAVCNAIPNSTAKHICLALSGYTLAHLGAVFVHAATHDCKVEVKWKYSPVYKTKQYDCDD